MTVHNEWTICQDSGQPAVNGACPSHHGDACLVVVVPKGDIRQADVFECRYCGRQVDFRTKYHSDERGLWHWECDPGWTETPR